MDRFNGYVRYLTWRYQINKRSMQGDPPSQWPSTSILESWNSKIGSWFFKGVNMCQSSDQPRNSHINDATVMHIAATHQGLPLRAQANTSILTSEMVMNSLDRQILTYQRWGEGEIYVSTWTAAGFSPPFLLNFQQFFSVEDGFSSCILENSTSVMIRVMRTKNWKKYGFNFKYLNGCPAYMEPVLKHWDDLGCGHGEVLTPQRCGLKKKCVFSEHQVLNSDENPVSSIKNWRFLQNFIRNLHWLRWWCLSKTETSLVLASPQRSS